MQPNKIKTDHTKIGTVLSFMQEGVVAKWAELQLEQCLEHGYPKYKDLQNAIETTFKLYMLKEQVQTELDRLKQGSKTIEKYNTKAAILFADADIEDQVKTIRIYRRGLKKAIRQQIKNMNQKDRPKTLDG